MRYIINTVPYDETGIYSEIVKPITDRNGEKFAKNRVTHPRSSLSEVSAGVDVRQVGDAYLKINRRQKIADYLCYPYMDSMILATEVIEAFDENGITLDPSIYRWPLHAIDSVTGKVRKEYVILWPMKCWYVLDLLKSEVKYSEGKKEVIIYVKNWVLDEEIIPVYDLFCTDHDKWLASEKAKALIEENGFCGFELTPPEEQRPPFGGW